MRLAGHAFAATAMIALLGTGLGCSGSTDVDGAGATLTTDASEYVAVPLGEPGPQSNYQFKVIARFVNNSNTPAHLGCCDRPYFGVLLASDSGQSAYDPAIALTANGTEVIVAPGQVRVDTLTITGPTGRDGHTGVPIGAMEGEFVLLYASEPCNAVGGCRSNKFSVHLQR